MFTVYLAFVVSAVSICETANILYVVPFSSKSHYIMLKPIGLELARRGHNVTVITAHRENNHPANYRQVMVDDGEIWDVIGGGRPNVFDMAQLSAEKFHELILWGGGKAFSEMALSSKQVRDFLHENNTFDVVICEQFFNEVFNILAHKYSAPLVLVTTFGNCMKHNIVTRNPLQVTTVVSEFLDLKDPTGFWSRMRNLYFTAYEYVWWRYWFLGENEKLIKKYIPNLPEPVPSLFEVQQQTALMLVNGHFSFDNPIAYLPNIIEIGGIHLTRSNATLPKDLQEILDDAAHGVVYVNFGTNVRSSELPVEKVNGFLNVFRKLKQIVIWKWEDDSMPNKPNNLIIREWMPQKEVLAHPNVKVFISHGGLIGTQEAVYHGVPLIGIPVYADQYNNLLQAVHHGFGKILPFNDINEQLLEMTLNEVLGDESYKNNAEAVAKRFKDRPMTPLDTAVFWIEYVIRNKGASFMKNPAIELSWIEYNMLDVYAFILGVIVAGLYITYIVLRFIKYIYKKKIGMISNKKKRM